MFHTAEPPKEYPNKFDLSEDDELEIEYFRRIMQVEGTQPEMHLLFVSDQEADGLAEQKSNELYLLMVLRYGDNRRKQQHYSSDGSWMKIEE